MKYAFVIAIAFVTIAAPASAQTAAQLNAQELARIQSAGPAGGPGGPPAAMPVNMAPPPMAGARGCPPGSRWVAAGYAKKGKWRPAGCVRR